MTKEKKADSTSNPRVFNPATGKWDSADEDDFAVREHLAIVNGEKMPSERGAFDSDAMVSSPVVTSGSPGSVADGEAAAGRAGVSRSTGGAATGGARP